MFLDVLGKLNFHPTDLCDIPLLPVSAFKKNSIKSGNYKAEIEYLSSTTSGGVPSRHLVRSKQWYVDNAIHCFETNYGDIANYAFFGLLPSYLERSGSSLIEMTNTFIQQSGYPGSGFFLNDFESLHKELSLAKENNEPAIFLGVSYALLDFAEQYPIDLAGMIIMETGGMKGRRKEMPRAELHNHLIERFNVSAIHSEYGMTELLSQAYSKGHGIFKATSRMKILCKQITDPLEEELIEKSGLIGVVDLANIDSCAFLLTDDLGRKIDSTHFEVIGRTDHSEIRGCNLMVSDL
jgi:hypothetical protein